MIKCDELKTKLEKRTEERTAQHETDKARWEEKLAKSKAEWLARHRAGWETALNTMADALIDDEPITADMIPGMGRGYTSAVTVWAPPAGEVTGDYEPPGVVRDLLVVLELHAGQEISTSELAKLGIGAEQWRAINRFLSKAWG